MKNAIRLITMAVALLAGGGMLAHAQTSVWTGAVDNNWSTADNWNPAGAPNGNTTTAVVESASAIINVDGDYTIKSFLIVSNGVANGSTVALDGTGTLTIDINGPTSAGAGFQNLAEGAGTVLEFNCNVTIANSAGSAGSQRTRLFLGNGTNNVIRFGAGSTLTLNSHMQASDGDGRVEFNCTLLGSSPLNIYAENAYFGDGFDTTGYASQIIIAGTSKITFDGGIMTRNVQNNSGSGTIVFNAANVFSNGLIRGLNGAALHLVVNASQDSLGQLDVGGQPSTIDPAGGTLSFADSSGETWGGGSLTISTNFAAGDIRFGTTSNALSELQLLAISAEGEIGGALLDADGYLSFAGPPPVISGDTVVDFNKGSVSTNVRPADVESDSGYTWDFSDTIPLYDTGSGQNNTIYGGLITTWAPATTNFNPEVALTNGAIWIQMSNSDLQAQSGSTSATFSATSAKGMYIWNQDDFLLGSGGTISAAEGNQLLFQLQYQWGGTTTRFVVKQGGVYYVSDASQGGGGTLIIDPSDPTINWAPIDTLDYTVGGPYAPVNFTDIEAVGIFFDVNVGAQMFLTYPDFQARLDVYVPPPTEISDVSSSLVAGQMILSWQGTNTAVYGLQMREDLVSGDWSNVVTNMAGVNDIMSVTNATDAPQAFFRTILEN